MKKIIFIVIISSFFFCNINAEEKNTNDEFKKLKKKWNNL